MEKEIAKKASKGSLPLLIFAIVSFVLSAAASFLYIYAHNVSYDGALHHFESNNVPLILSVAFFAVSVILSFICAFFYRKTRICDIGSTEISSVENETEISEIVKADTAEEETEEETSSDSDISTAAPEKNKKYGEVYISRSKFEAAARILIGALFMYTGISQLVSGISSEMISILGKIVAALICPMQVVAGIAMIFSAFGEKQVPKGMNRVLSLFPVLAALFMLLNLYFDSRGLPMNDPDLMLALAAVGVSSFCLLSESRFLLGINTVSIASFTIILQLSFVLGGAMTLLLINNRNYTCPLGVNYFILAASYSLLAIIRLVQLIKALRK